MYKHLFFLLTLLVLIAVGCKDPYGPPARSINQSYLVVEGYLNGNGPTSIRLSRTFKLDDSARVQPELSASVNLQSKGGALFGFVPMGNGEYRSAQLPMQVNEEYRLYIKTADGKDYISDYVPYKPTPEIDSVSWERKENGVQIYANTHDPANNTTYYRWDYDETWEFRSSYLSFYEYKNGQVVMRDPNENLFTCWKTESSTNILLGSSASLQSDIISLKPITFIPNNSWKLSVKYSINLRQYALTKEAYQYWQNLMKISEQLGSIFDPQPSEIRGNIRNPLDPDELVIGYISAGTINEKRIFISNSQLPGWNYRAACDLLITPGTKDSIDFYFRDGGYTPIDVAELPSGGTGWSYSTTLCVDCRLRGVNVRPLFWQ